MILLKVRCLQDLETQILKRFCYFRQCLLPILDFGLPSKWSAVL